jgi:hypothetical protein
MATPSSTATYEHTSVVPSYLAETSIFEAVTGLSLVISLLQTISSAGPTRWNAQAHAVPKTKRFFHLIVTLCSILVSAKRRGWLEGGIDTPNRNGNFRVGP